MSTADATVIGLGAMLGAGVFAVWGPAARAAGAGLLVGLGVACLVAYCNARASARLAARYPESGGTYVYGRRRLGRFWGCLAGFSFLAGKLASCAAMALTFGVYVAPGAARPLAVAAVAVASGVNMRGVRRTAAATRVIVALVLASLAAFAGGALAFGHLEAARIGSPFVAAPLHMLRAGGLIFFAFAGYARIATLGEEVRDPARAIPRAIGLALGTVLAIYLLVALLLLATLGPGGVAVSQSPLLASVSSRPALAAVVRAGAAVACLGVLLSLLAGLSRTAFAMAAEGDLPRPLAVVEPRYKVPRRAELAAAVIVAVAVALADVRGAIGFSAFTVLVYYGIANAAALTLRAGRRAAALACVGLVGCLALALSLPVSSLAVGAAVVAAGALVYAIRPSGAA